MPLDHTSIPTLVAGIPSKNLTLLHRVRFAQGDPAACIDWPAANGQRPKRTFIVRDIELQRARAHANADECASPGQFAPSAGLSADRETATAQATAECLARAGVKAVRSDRTLPLIFSHHLAQRGVAVVYDPDLGVIERRRKTPQEIETLRDIQRRTERVVERVCGLIASATPGRDGTLLHEGQPLTSERTKVIIDRMLLDDGLADSPSIVACGPQGGDCHDRGSGPLRTEQPVIIDVFPTCLRTHYVGDCTRTVVHGQIPPEVERMHAAVVEAKRSATRAIAPGVSAHDVHARTKAAITGAGFAMGLGGENDPPSRCAMPHGTGHGVGLEVHEPPLLVDSGPELFLGDVVTVEPGLYRMDLGGVRVEDVVAVVAGGFDNLGSLHEGLEWK